MADKRTPEDIRREIETERTELARSVDQLRSSIRAATDVGAKLGANLPVAAAAALGAGFVLSGGIGATVRLLFRRSREGSTKARIGRFVVVERD
jgi:uncharacterized protein DUF3618